MEQQAPITVRPSSQALSVATARLNIGFHAKAEAGLGAADIIPFEVAP